MNSFGRGDKQDDQKKASVITRETIGMTLLLFGAVIFLIAITGPYLFGDPGVAITAFFVGLFGLFFYPLDLIIVYLGIAMVCGKMLIPVKWLLRVALLTLSVFAIVHLVTSERFVSGGYGEYLAGCWGAAGEYAKDGTGGGILLGLIAYPVRILLSAPGAYVVFSLLAALALFFFLMGTPLKNLMPVSRKRRVSRKEVKEEEPAPVTFDELSEPARTPAPVSALREEPKPEPASYRRETNMSDARRMERDASREILYSGDRDRADDYLKNLIFSRDSQFNQRKAQAPTASANTGKDYSERAFEAPAERGYSERYASQAETARPAMPRRIVPAEKTTFGEENFNYPQTPTYRAPSALRSEPAPEKAETPAAERIVFRNTEKSEPVRPAFRAPEEDKSTPPAPQAPVRESSRDLFRSAFSRREEPAPEKPEAPAPQAPAVQAPARESSRDLFRSAFSRREEPASAEPETKAPVLRDEQDAEDESRIRRAFDELDDARNRRAERFQEEPARTVGFGDMPERGFSEARAEEEPRLSLPEDEPDEPEFGVAEEPEDNEPDFEDPDEPVLDAPSFRAPDRAVREEVRSDSDLFDDDEDFDDFEEQPRVAEALRAPRTVERSAPAEPVPDTPAPAPAHHVYKKYVHPDMTVFNEYDDTVSVSEEEIERNSAIIKDTLAGFHIDAEVVKVTPASSVTRYDIDVPANVAVRTVMKRDQEIAMRLRARDGVNIYSNSEMGLISVEVPNAVRATVGIRSILQAEEYLNSKPDALMFVMGKDIEGRNVCGNIAKMKHLLVAGSTGSGKSVCLNAMLISLICKYSPEELRLILVDPKKVEFEIFDGLPHLMINEIISDAQKTIKALNWAIKEMERRYEAFSAMTRSGRLVRNLEEYNAAVLETGEEKLPKIVIVVDELADLMSVAKKDIEERIQRLAQKARAAGMHLVLATQRPSVDVITGVIKTNLPTRIAFRVGAEVDSRTILDDSGAEKLLGNGDMLYHTDVMYNCLRVQGAYISSKEVELIVKDIKEHNEAYFDNSVAEFINKSEQTDEEGGGEAQGGGEVDAVYIKALGIVVKLGTASISLIQRKCSVGYNHAGKIIEWMEAMNYISPFEGKAKPRTVLMTPEQFENIYGKLD